ncbi:MAG: ATP-binding protein [Planctomycetaceae bacterium]
MTQQKGNDDGDMPTDAERQEALMTAEERFQLLMECVRDFAIFMLDPEGRVIDWNLGAENILGYTQAEIIGHPFSTFFTPQEREAGVPDQELKIAAEVGRADDNRWHVRKDGTHFFANGVTTALRDETGGLKGYAKVLRDNTERKRMEEELRGRAEALVEADRRKDEFLALLAHELRNPLAPIFNALTLLSQENVAKPMQQELRSMMERQVRQLSRLVDDLLDVSRITRGKISLQKKLVEVRVIIEHAVETARPLIESRKHHLSVSVPAQPICVNGDPIRLQQVLSNILNNASKYGEERGRITLTSQQEGNEAVVRVRDTGIGIAPAMLPRIFDLFTQADQTLDRSLGGLGIGLTLVKRLVELHEGKVEAHSEGLGKGSEFVVRLPIAVEENKQDSPCKSDTPIRQERSFRILVVDDNDDAADSLNMLLKMAGHEVWTAHCGPTALQAAHEHKPELLILDIGLPVLDGFQVAQRLREAPEFKQAVMIAVSGYGQDGDRQRSKEAGFDFHFVKPMDFQRLQDLFTSLLKGGSSDAARPA